MILVALGNRLAQAPAATEIDRQSRLPAQTAQVGEPGNLMVRRFHTDLRLDSVAVLLQERVPADVPLEFPQPGDLAPLRRIAPPVSATPWQPTVSNSPGPQVHYLSNGHYRLLITSSGGGVSRWQGFDLTRWRADTTLDDSGSWIYVQDCESGELWSAAQQPVNATASSQIVRFFAHKAEFHRIDAAIAVTMEVTVVPDHDVELRRVTLLNQDDRPRRLAVTSYGEVVMAAAGDDSRHQAFNKLFIESELLPNLDGLLFRRRPRRRRTAIFLAHLVVGVGKSPQTGRGYESDRARFLGRGGSVRVPAALDPDGGAAGRWGWSHARPDFQPAARDSTWEPGESAQLVFLTAAAGSQSKLMEATGQYLSLPAVEHGFAQARARAELELRQSGLSTTELERFQTLLGALLYPVANLRAEAATLAANTRGQPGLWGFGISGDYPIMLVTIEDEDGLGLIKELVQAHIYWRRRGLQIDLVILNERQAGYDQELRDQLYRLLTQLKSDTWLNRRGGIFLLYAEQLQQEDRVLLASAARVVLAAGQHSLPFQLEALQRGPEHLPVFIPERFTTDAATETAATAEMRLPDQRAAAGV